MAEYNRKSFKFIDGGIQTNRPVNLVDDGCYPMLKNITRLVEGTLTARYGYTATNLTLDSPVHTIKRVNNIRDANTPYARLFGTSTNLYLGPTLLDTGYSGNPLSITPYRPLQSPETWAYVWDANQAKKYKLDGTAKYKIGIFPPVNPPVVELGTPVYATVDHLQSSTGWVNGGAAGSPSAGLRVPASTVIAAILYDTGNTGWACVGFSNPASDYAFLGIGAQLQFGPSEVAVCEEVCTQLANTAVGSIMYDADSAGLCSIQMGTPVAGILRNQILRLNPGGGNQEDVRVLDVVQGPNGLYSFRCLTIQTHNVSEVISSQPCARVYFGGIHSAGDAVSATDVRFTCTPLVDGNAGAGFIDKTVNLDLSQANGRPLHQHEYLHISLRADIPVNIIELRIYLDTDSSVNDFAHNAFYMSFRPSDFTQTAAGTLTALASRQTSVQNTQTDQVILHSVMPDVRELVSSPSQGSEPYFAAYNVPTPAQSNVGTQAWTEFIMPVSQLAIIGGDITRSLASVKALRIWANVVHQTVIEASSWWIGGGYGADVAPTSNGIGYQTGFNPYRHRYRYRSSSTGAFSSPSPPQYSGLVPRRGRMVVNVTRSTDVQVDKIDIERMGGGVNDNFHYVGTINNDGSYYNDDLSDAAIETSTTFPEDAFIPFPVDDLPHKGVVNVSGTSIQWVSGDAFNTAWARGTQIIINGTAYTLNAPPVSTTRLTTVENVGSWTNVSYFIPNPTIMGRPVPAVWGPLRERLFGCGDPNNPGILYFTYPDNPDCASDTGFVEVTSPSEPLMNGVVYQGSSIVFSTERAFRLQPSYGDNPNIYTPEALASGRGLYARYGLCVGPRIWFVGRDGIYEYAADGGASSITDSKLYNLFPHDSQPGVTVTVSGTSVIAPDYRHPNSLRLSYCNNWLYFDYLGIDNQYHTLAYHTLARSWWPYDYTPGASLHYTEEGQNVNSTLIGFSNGVIDTMSGYTDNGTGIHCVAYTGSMDLGDTRANKQFGDLTIDADAEAEIDYRIGFDNDSVSFVPIPAANFVPGRTYQIYDLNTGLGYLRRNISLLTSFTTSLGISAPVLYEWQPSWLIKPEFTVLRATDWFYANGANLWVQGLRLTCDTQGQRIKFHIQKDGGVETGITISVTASGETVLPFTWPTPFQSHGIRIVPEYPSVPGNSWRIINVEWIYQSCPEHGAVWCTQPLTHGLNGWQHLGELYFQYASSASMFLRIIGDTTTVSVFFPGTDGIPRKVRMRCPVLKAKTFQYIATGPADLQVYYLESEVRVKQWGSTEGYKSIHPFGDMTQGYFSVPGARI